jgi:integrase
VHSGCEGRRPLRLSLPQQNLSKPYRSSPKISHRAWFSPEEYKQLYEATRKRARAEAGGYKWESEQLHDYVLFAVNTGLRPDEAWHLEFRDVTIQAA